MSLSATAASSPASSLAGSPMEEEEDFGLIRPSLMRQLRSILDQYPDDGQILKELLQNAEDAGARVVKFLHDEHHHPNEPTGLYHPGLAKFQGPALYAYNDATFDEKDWKGIRMLQDSIKENDPMKVGRFGLGFKSVLHMTDLPSVLSGNRLAVIDPHELYFTYQGQPTTGYSWNLTQRAAEIKQLPDQFEPFKGLFGCTDSTFEEGFFRGTLFRFPLRESASELSDTLYDDAKMDGLFSSFKADAHLVLIFLKSVEAVELYRRSADRTQPVLQFRVALNSTCAANVRQARQAFLQKIDPSQWMAQPVSTSYPLTIETQVFATDGVSRGQTFNYLVTEYYAGGQASTHLKALHGDSVMGNIPLVGTALALDPPVQETPRDVDVVNANSELSPDTEEESTAPKGHVFCVLPLPVEEKSATGLPVHVNGFFSVSQNRRHLKWPTAGQTIRNDKALLWNHCLLQELLPKCYVELIFFAIKDSMSQRGTVQSNHVMTAIPNLLSVSEKWQNILEPFFVELFKHNVFYTKVTSRDVVDSSGRNLRSKGQWIQLRECIFDCMRDRQVMKETVKEVLLSAGVKVVEVPVHVLHALGAYGKHCPETITPGLVRQTLRARPDTYRQLSLNKKLVLLEYVIKDEDFPDLDQLQMLPLANGQFDTFATQRKGATPVYLPSSDHPRVLLPGLERQLIRDGLDATVMDKLTKLTNEGCCQLRHLEKRTMLSLLPGIIPKDWFQHPVVTYNPVSPPSSSYPSRQWLSSLWHYLRVHCPNDLSDVNGLPVLPVIDTDSLVELIPLSLPSTAVNISAMGITLSPPCVKMLEVCGLNMIANLPEYVQSHAAVIGNYIRLPLPLDVLEALEIAFQRQKAEQYERLNAVTSAEEKRALRSFLSRLEPGRISEGKKHVLWRLPLFELYETEPPEKPTFVSLKEVNRAAPLVMPPIDIDSLLIDLRADDARLLARVNGVEPQPVSTLLRHTIISDLSEGRGTTLTMSSVVTYIKQQLPVLVAEDPTFIDHLQSLPFIPTCSGQLMCACDLFNPQSAFLQKLFYNEDVFPADDYRDELCLSLLRQLGLREQTSVKAAELLDSAQLVEQLSTSSEKSAEALQPLVDKAEAIMTHIDQNVGILDEKVKSGNSLVRALSDIKWVPVHTKPSKVFPESLPWYESPSPVSSPKDVRPLDFALLVGSVMSVTTRPVANAVALSFNWNSPVPLTLVLAQLKAVMESYKSEEKSKYMTVILTIYDDFSRRPSEEVIAALDDVGSWVWHGDGFSPRDQIVMRRPFTDLRPYLYTLPTELLVYEELFVRCGVLQECDNQRLIHVLRSIRDKSQHDTEIPEKDTSRERQLVVDILNKIQTTVNTLDADQRAQLLVPVFSSAEGKSNLRLVSVDEATYCDTKWLQQGLDKLEFDEQDGILLIDPWLPTATAESLGVPSLMSRMLHAEELHMVGFGQSEPLTSRLHRLLEDYTDGLSIPKELIQNADDAGATEVCFLYDERTNDDHKKYLIDDGMKECHGPALWVYNNGVFTDLDFENITKLGAGTKELCTDKIGRFGLGFNAVYNLTDVPTFMSRNYIVIFDPHTKHLGRGIRDQTRPGIKIDRMKNKTLLKKLPDQFQPFEGVFGCSIQGSGDSQSYYDGTLFRLPLRTQLQASKSAISSLYYDRDEMARLIQMMVDLGSRLLLFTQNVRTVKVFHLPADVQDPQESTLIYHIRKEVVRIARPLTRAYMRDPVRDCAGKSQTGATSGGEFNMLGRGALFLERMIKSKSTTVPESEIPAASLVVQVSKDVTDGAMALVNREPSSGQQFWLLSFTTSNEKCLELAKSAPFRQNGYNPMAGVAVALTRSQDGYVAVPLEESHGNGVVFCYLPLPIRSHLPVHINGSFAVQSNRRYLTKETGDDKDTTAADWNRALLQDAVCQAYVQALYDAQKISPRGTPVDFYQLWPGQANLPVIMEPLVGAFFDYVVKHADMPVCNTGSKSISVGNAVFLSPSMCSNLAMPDTVKETFDQHGEAGSVVELPTRILKTLKSRGHVEYLKDKLYSEVRFFKEVVFRDIGKLSANVRDPLVLYALDMNSPTLDELLVGSRCIPASPNGETLVRPNELVHPKLWSKVYDPEDGCFPYGTEFLTHQRLASLQRLGMQTHELTWSNILERARSLSSLAEKDEDDSATTDRLVNLLAVLDLKLQRAKGEKNEEKRREVSMACQQLRQIEMIPIMPKPALFPLPWKGDECDSHTLLAPNNLHVQDKRYLVSSTQFLVKDSFLTLNIKEALGVNEQDVAIEHVMTQLEHALALDPQTLKNPESLKELRKACFRIYAYLQRKCATDQETAELVAAALSDRKCILVGDSYVYPRQLCLSPECDCAPYLYSIPAEMVLHFKAFLQIVGVRKHFNVSDHMVVLQELHQQGNGLPLSKQNLKVALGTVRQLNTCMKREDIHSEEVKEKYGAIYLPNVAGVLQESSELCFNDCPWLKETGSMDFTHPDLTYHTSNLLGVKTKRQEALAKHAKAIPFGQKERLTNSLRRILSSYPCDHEIFKELIQNADDAAATEVNFIRDPRHHKTTHLFENCWRPLQGPALCVYNNSSFTKDDLEGIQQLGEGSKGNDPNKTGQYGIGFSSVYHLTDAPSLLTSGPDLGETLCVFDPTCQYVPGATPAEPGMRFSDLPTLRQTFPDVFSCYLEDVLDVKDATLFRFPLRTRDMATRSDICKSAVSIGKVEMLLDKLQTEVIEILLFTNHLKRISISHVDATSGHLVTDYSAWVELSEEDETARHDFKLYVKQCASDIKEGHLTIEQLQPRKVVYELQVCDTQGRQETWVVSQQVGIRDDAVVPESVVHAFSVRDLMLLPRGGTACLLQKRYQGAVSMESRKQRVFCFLPLPVETSLPVHINGHFALGYENRRHLWTNLDGAGYQQDWNNFLCSEVIAVSYLNLMLYIRMHGLNSTLVDNVAQVTCTKTLLESALRAYQEYFPNFDPERPQWDPLVMNFYQKSACMEFAILPALKELPAGRSLAPALPSDTQNWKVSWFPPKGQGKSKAFFCKIAKTDPTEEQGTSLFGKFKSLFRSTEPSPHKSESQVLKEVLLECNFEVLEATPVVIDNYSRSGVDVNLMTPESVMLFFQSYSSEEPLCTFPPLPVKLSDSPFKSEEVLTIVLKYCKGDKDFLRKLPGTPLLLTSDSSLRVYDADEPVFHTKYHDLVPACGERFLHPLLQKGLFANVPLQDVPVFVPFTIKSLSTILHHRLPDKYRSAPDPVPWSLSSSEHVNAKWLQCLWDFIIAEAMLPREQNPGKRDIRREQVAELLEPLKEWAIIPAKTSTKFFLYTPETAGDVVKFETLSSQLQFIKVLLRLEVAQFAAEGLILGEDGKSLFRNLLTTLDCPVDILRLVHKKITQTDGKVKLLGHDSFELLCYFSEKVPQFSIETDTEKIQELLRALPIYMTIHGDMIPLTGCLVYTLPAKIPTYDIDVWQSRSGTVFLERSEALQPLYDFLGCATISTLEVYCQFILQHLEYLSPEGRTIHLHHIYNHYLNAAPGSAHALSGDKRRELLEALKEVNFIEDKDGELHPASDFYDPENLLFQVMFPEDKLPPRTQSLFRDSEWLAFLRLVGLQSEVTRDKVVGFAHQVSCEGREPGNPRALMRSKVLTEHLLTMQNAQKEEILKTISTEPFLAPERVRPELSDICRQFGDIGNGHIPYVAFSECLSKDYEELVWTKASLLPTWADPTKQAVLPQEDQAELMGWLGVHEKPPPTLVASHLLALCDFMQSDGAWHTDAQRRHAVKDVFRSVYRFLQQNGLENEEVHEMLHARPCVLVENGCGLTLAQHTAKDMYESEEVRPYLYKLPVEFGEFHRLFKYLGASDMPTFEQFASVLEHVHAKAGGKRLTPPELVAAYKAVRGIFTALEKSAAPHDVGVRCLYLPSVEGHLVDSSALVVNDVPHFFDRVGSLKLQFLFDLKECGLRFNSAEDFLAQMPKPLRPCLLSSYFQETLVDESKKRVTSKGVAAELCQRLTCEPFMRAVTRLIRHEAHRLGNKLDEQSMFDVLDRLSTIRVYSSTQLQTQLKYNGSVVPNSQADKRCFVEKVVGRTDIWHVYILRDAHLDHELLIPLAEVINSMLSGLLHDSVLYLLPILVCKEEEIQKKLDALNVRLDQSHVTYHAPTLPPAGAPVHADHLPLLVKGGGGSLSVGDYVVYKQADDAEPVHAILTETITRDFYGELDKPQYLVNIGKDQDSVIADSDSLFSLVRK